MYFLIACLKELSNLGAKKRRPDDDDEAAKKDAPPPAKRSTRSKKKWDLKQCRISILAFLINFCPIKSDLSGNTV